MTVREDAAHVLTKLATFEQVPGDVQRGRYSLNGSELAQVTGLDADRINDAVVLLEENGYVEVLRFLGTAPFEFGSVELKARGRAEAEHLFEAEKRRKVEAAKGGASPPTAAISSIPVGSPYGFTDQDWEAVTLRRNDRVNLVVVFGHQWDSTYFKSDDLRRYVGDMFAKALGAVLSRRKGARMTLDYRPLRGGYGEHLFNDIARDIISADIAVFDTSDANPNVMIELGVALTWGTRVLPIRDRTAPRPPSDISGQTWADYEDGGARWVDPEHQPKLEAMVERAARKKQAL